MRNGLLISAVIHVAALVLAFVATADPTPFVTPPPETIAVDLVTPDEAPPEEPPKPQAEAQPAPKPAPETAAKPASKPKDDWLLPELKPAPPDPKPAPEPQQRQARPPAPANASAPPSPSQPPSQSAEPPPPDAAPPSEPASAQSPEPIAVDPALLAALMEVPLPTGDVKGPVGGAQATARAGLTVEEVAAFKAHLRKCWSLSPGVADADRIQVVLRLALKPNGTLASDPDLVSVSAAGSPGAPDVVKSALKAVRQCQPYGMLPAAKYKEWKLLDLNVSPREMAGG